jgi:hypothetical protein
MYSARKITWPLFFVLFVPVITYARSVNDLSSALTALKNHINGTSLLSAAQILQKDSVIQNNDSLLGTSAAIITQAFDVVTLYDSIVKPLWINSATAAGLSRAVTSGKEIHYALFTLQQAIIDFVYASKNLTQYQAVLRGLGFKTSTYFPGACAPPADPTTAQSVTINASQPAIWGSPVMYYDEPARRPTGCYAAPGSIVTVTVPAAMRNTGFNVRVGAHSWDLAAKPSMKRLDRVSTVYPITGAQTLVANPLGGNIYLEVPYKASAGIVTVTIANAVRSPFFSATAFHKTTAAEWLNTERTNPGPWADFESDKFMMQVPTNWIYKYGDPTPLMASWDTAMDGVSAFMGRPMVQPKTVLYMQTDVVIRGSAYFPGYPQSNTPYTPTSDAKGSSTHWLLKGGRYADAVIFHELGHAHQFTKFAGETEAAVNLLYPAYQNSKFGVNLDTAFGMSFGNMPQISLDQASIMWMVTQNFRDGKPMDITNSTKNEVRYQQRGYGKYIEIARLFGWDALNDFWYSVNQDYNKGITYPRNSDPTDNRILRMSRAAGADLRPLIHFWGVHPQRNDTLKPALVKEGLRPSSKIYDALIHYKSILPKSNQEFQAHANIIYPKGIDGTGKNPDYGEGWYSVWLTQYSTTHGTAGQAAVQAIIDLYFPTGRPATETTPPNPNPATFAVLPRATSTTAVTMTATTGTDASGPVMYQFTETSGNPGGTTSAWQSSPTYIDNGLTTDLTYSYSVRIRDALGNIGAASERISVVANPVFSAHDGMVPASQTIRLTSIGITVPLPGSHTVSVYDVQGRLLFTKGGNAPAYYPFRSFSSGHGRGLYVIHAVTPLENRRQTILIF